MLTQDILALISASAMMAAFWELVPEDEPGGRAQAIDVWNTRFPTLGHDHAITVKFVRRLVPRMIGGTTLEFLTRATVIAAIEPFRLAY